MKLIYDSGPLTVLQHVVALIGASIAFVLSLGLASLPFFAFVQNGFQLGFLILAAFAIFLAFVLSLSGVQVLAPVFLRFSTRVYLNGSRIEVVRPFPFKVMNQVFDLDRINTIEVVHRRKGGSVISVLYRFCQDGPTMKDSDSIGPFYTRRQAEAIAAAIQSELIPQNFDVRQIELNREFQQRLAWKFVVGFLIVFELIVCSSVISGWNRMGLIDRLVSVFMVFFPVLLWYRVRREIRNEPISKSDTQVKNTNLM